MLDFTRTLSVPSAARYVTWRVGHMKRPIVLRARTGERFELRPAAVGQGGNNDYGVAYEILVHDLYGPTRMLDRDKVRLVVDLGANVGFSVIRWLRLFPQARVIAYEPHPGHAMQVTRNVALNGARERVELRQVGAGAAAGEAILTDAGSGSTVVEAGSGIRIGIADVFPDLMGRRIDLLKMDIEGGEYDLLADPRFARLDIACIAMEWHRRGDHGLDWCKARLSQLGFDAEDFAFEGSHGMLWAIRRQGAS